MDVFGLRELKIINGQLHPVLNVEPVDFDIEWLLVGKKAYNLVTGEIVEGFSNNHSIFYTPECTFFFLVKGKNIDIKVYHKSTKEWTSHNLTFSKDIKRIWGARGDTIMVEGISKSLFDTRYYLVRIKEDLTLEEVFELRGIAEDVIFFEDEKNGFTNDSLIYQGKTYKERVCSFGEDEIFSVSEEDVRGGNMSVIKRRDRKYDKITIYPLNVRRVAEPQPRFLFQKAYLYTKNTIHFNNGERYRHSCLQRYPIFPITTILGKYFIVDGIRVYERREIDEFDMNDWMRYAQLAIKDGYSRGIHRMYERWIPVSRFTYDYFRQIPSAIKALTDERIVTSILYQIYNVTLPTMLDSFLAALPDTIQLPNTEAKRICGLLFSWYISRGKECPLIYNKAFRSGFYYLEANEFPEPIGRSVKKIKAKIRKMPTQTFPSLPYDMLSNVDFIVLKGATYDKCLELACYHAKGVWFNMRDFPLFPGFVQLDVWRQRQQQQKPIDGGSSESTYLVYDVALGEFVG